jgi:hypothetical protein
MIESTYCEFQSRAGVKRYEKFHEPLVVEPADCRLAAKKGKFKINRKEHPFEMNIRRWVIVNMVGGLDNNNCEVNLFEVRGVTHISKVVTAAYKIYVPQRDRANDLTGSTSSCWST